MSIEMNYFDELSWPNIVHCMKFMKVYKMVAKEYSVIQISFYCIKRCPLRMQIFNLILILCCAQFCVLLMLHWLQCCKCMDQIMNLTIDISAKIKQVLLNLLPVFLFFQLCYQIITKILKSKHFLTLHTKCGNITSTMEGTSYFIVFKWFFIVISTIH